MIQNPYNGIILVGDSRGQATMWCPNAGIPVVKMLCHKGTVNSMSVDSGGICFKIEDISENLN